MALFRIKYLWKPLLGVLALGLLLPAAGRAQDDEEEKEGTRAPFEVSDATADLLSSLKETEEAQNWEKAIQLIDAGLRKVKAGSYDEETLYRVRAQMSYRKNDYMGSMSAAERCLAIDDEHHYLDRKTRREMLYWVAQIAFNEGATSKVVSQQDALYAKADRAMQEWLKGAKEFTSDNLQFIAMLYFYRAQLGSGIAGAEEKLDRGLMEKALEWTERLLRSMTVPKDNFYQLKLAELFQLGRFKDGAELLELLIKKKPDSKNYWQQLFNTYVQLASEAAAMKPPDEQDALAQNIRAIVTAERAQKLGFLNAPKDNFNMAVIYLGIGQPGEACDVLDRGLKTNTIERTRQNYELLANSYQQIHHDNDALRTLDAATTVFPHSGQLEYEIAQIYFAGNNSKEAFEHMKRCIQKGGTEEKHTGWLFYAYLALDLKEFDEALMAAKEAQKFPKGLEEGKKMEDAINATIKDREARIQSQT